MRDRQGEYRRLLTRRQLLQGAAGLGLAAAGGPLLSACASRIEGQKKAGEPNPEPPPETTSIALHSVPNVQCFAALYRAEPFLREEGFTDVRYPKYAPKDFLAAMKAGQVDLGLGYAAAWIPMIDAGSPLVMLGGIHVGCWQIFGTGDIRSLRDLKGKTVSIISPQFTDGIFMAMTLNDVGLDINKDVKVVNYLPAENARILSSGEVDAVVAFPPITKELRAKGIARVVVDSMVDPPWSNYYCCTAVTNRAWMETHPVAAKRALRAIVKGANVIAQDPDGSARFMVDRGYSENFDYTCEILKEIPYNNIWRDFDPVDSVRFYALRLKQAGLIKSTPEEILEKGTDFTYLESLRKELRSA
ncbi:MAG TPA: ABC transporter substrate-binding protein [Acidimicrobiia bacterium]|nr:ABC transporter substrate-binding protein [Acidimicrobiia bacterium]